MAPLSSAAGENGGLTEEERERERETTEKIVCKLQLQRVPK